MAKELTIKVNYVMGDKSGLTQAAQTANTTANTAAQGGMKPPTYPPNSVAGAAVQAGTRAYNIGLNDKDKPKGMLENLLTGGLPGLMKGFGVAGLAGIAAYGAVGKGAQDFQSMTTGGGTFLRGHGFAGIADSIYGFLSGRATKEALQDMKLSRGDFQAQQTETRLAAQRETDVIARGSMFRPITEINPLERIKQERFQARKTYEFMRKQQGEAIDNLNVNQALDKMRNDRIGRMRPGGGVEEINALKEQTKLQDDLISRAKEMVEVRKQQVQIEHDALQARKQSIKDDASKFGSMSPEERVFAMSAAQRMRAGQQLTPEEIQSLSGFASAQPELTKVLRKNADQSGFTEFIQDAGDDALRAAAGRAKETNVTLEAALDEDKLAKAIWNEAKNDMQGLITDIKVMAAKKLELESKLRQLQEKRQVVAGNDLN